MLIQLSVITEESVIDFCILIDNIIKHHQTLNSLNYSTEYWDTLIIYFILTKHNKAMTHEWEKHRLHVKFPTLDETNLEILEVNHSSIKCKM